MVHSGLSSPDRDRNRQHSPSRTRCLAANFLPSCQVVAHEKLVTDPTNLSRNTCDYCTHVARQRVVDMATLRSSIDIHVDACSNSCSVCSHDENLSRPARGGLTSLMSLALVTPALRIHCFPFIFHQPCTSCFIQSRWLASLLIRSACTGSFVAFRETFSVRAHVTTTRPASVPCCQS